jgi:hypothetical protein
MQSRTPVLASRAMLVSQFIVLRDCEDKIFGPPWEALRTREFLELAVLARNSPVTICQREF